MPYTIPSQTRIGHVHLKVSDIERSLQFYRDVLGFKVTQRYGASAVFISAGNYHHHIGLNTWHSKGAGPAPVNIVGLYHTAILYRLYSVVSPIGIYQMPSLYAIAHNFS